MRAPADISQLQLYVQCDILLAARMQKGTGKVSWSVASLGPGKWWFIRAGAAHWRSGFWAAVARWPWHAAAVSAGKDAKVTEMAWLASVQGAWALLQENWGLGAFSQGNRKTSPSLGCGSSLFGGRGRLKFLVLILVLISSWKITTSHQTRHSSHVAGVDKLWHNRPLQQVTSIELSRDTNISKCSCFYYYQKHINAKLAIEFLNSYLRIQFFQNYF